MIGLLRGRVVDSAANGTLVLDVGGVGYEVITPMGTTGRLKPDADGRLTLHVHTHVREDAIVLYGFAAPPERTAFRALIAIASVGPKVALAVLSVVSVEELVRLVACGEVSQLKRIPGIGKKTAERIVLELRDKLEPVAGQASPSPGPLASGQPDSRTQLREALLQMGWRPNQGERAVASVKDPSRPLGELVRDALQLLAP